VGESAAAAEKRISGAKALCESGIYGTAEAVPLTKSAFFRSL
jgi:hypothetical protein